MTQSHQRVSERATLNNEGGTEIVLGAIAELTTTHLGNKRMVYRTVKKQAWLVHMSQQLSLLSNVSRMEIIMRLCHGELTVGALADAVGLSQSALSQHLRKLKQVGAVKVRHEAQHRFYSINGDFLNGFRDNLLFFILDAQPKKRPIGCKRVEGE